MGCGRRSDGRADARTPRARTPSERRPSSNPGALLLGRRRAVARRLGTPVEHERCARLGTVGDLPALPVLRCLNECARLVTVGEDRRRMATCSVRLAKAKVAGSNPVFRSKSARISNIYRGPGFLIFLAAQRRRPPVHIGSEAVVASARLSEMLARGRIPETGGGFGALEQRWNIRRRAFRNETAPMASRSIRIAAHRAGSTLGESEGASPTGSTRSPPAGAPRRCPGGA